MLENIIKSLSISVSDLTSQVELMKTELRDLKNELNMQKETANTRYKRFKKE